MSNMNMPKGSNLTPEQKALKAAEHAKKMEELRLRYGGGVQPKAQEDTIASRYSDPKVKVEPHKDDDFTESTGV
jgi:hypothetical protein